MHDDSTDHIASAWEDFVPIYLPAAELPENDSSFDLSRPHYEVNYCELQGSETPCETSSGVYYGTTEPLTPRLCPRHWRELVMASAAQIDARKPSESAAKPAV